VDSRVQLLDGWDVFSTALYLELKRVISFLVAGICRPFRITAFGTYHGTSVIRRRALFVVETPFYLQAVYKHSANWCENWVLWLGEGHSVVFFHSY
jgi:hypothetical protein